MDHIAGHGVGPVEAEFVVCNARRPYPRKIGEDKFLVVGQLSDGTYIQVIYVFDPDLEIFVIHARPLTHAEKQRYRRRKK